MLSIFPLDIASIILDYIEVDIPEILKERDLGNYWANARGCEQVFKNGVLQTFIRGTRILHSFGDNPSQIFSRYGQVLGSVDFAKVRMKFTSDCAKLSWHRFGLPHRDGDKPAVCDSTTSETLWYQNGLIHRERKPAYVKLIIEFTENSILQRWYERGEIHRENGPAEIFTSTCRVTKFSDVKSTWYCHDKIGHCNDSKGYFPTQITRSKIDNYCDLRWLDDDEFFLHRDGPSKITYDSRGNLWKKEWFIVRQPDDGRGPLIYYETNGDVASVIAKFEEPVQVLHRDNGPAYIRYDNGKVVEKGWYQYGKLHREDGDAFMLWENGVLILSRPFFHNDPSLWK